MDLEFRNHNLQLYVRIFDKNYVITSEETFFISESNLSKLNLLESFEEQKSFLLNLMVNNDYNYSSINHLTIGYNNLENIPEAIGKLYCGSRTGINTLITNTTRHTFFIVG